MTGTVPDKEVNIEMNGKTEEKVVFKKSYPKWQIMRIGCLQLRPKCCPFQYL